MRDLELVTDRYLTKDWVKEVLIKHGWSCAFEKLKDYDELDIANEKGDYVLQLDLNRQDAKGNEVYGEYYDLEEIDEIKKDPRFSGFAPYYNIVSYYSDCYDYAVEFLYMLKKEGLKVYFRFCDYGKIKELKNQL